MNSRRKRVSGVLNKSARGFCVVTDAGDFWVLDSTDVDLQLIEKQVTIEGTPTGFDRFQLDWIGESSA